MSKDIDYFTNQFNQQLEKNRRSKPGYHEYGSNVMPILKLYKELSSYTERNTFTEALELFLVDPDEMKRKFAVTICLGFFILRDAI